MSDKVERFDGTFYNNFKAIWSRWPINLPLPETLLTAVASTLGGIKLVNTGLQVARGATFLEWWFTAPAFTSAAATTTVSELLTIVGGVGPALYAGLYLGTLILAAYETWGADAAAKVRPFIAEIEQVSGRAFDRVLESLLLSRGIGGSQLSDALHRARMLSNPKLYRRCGASGGW